MPIALSTDYIKPDEHNTDELVVFIQRLAEYIRFYKTDGNETAGQWVKFFSGDESFVYATISITNQWLPLDEIKKSNDDLGKLFDIVYSMLYDVDRWYNSTPDTSQLSTEIRSQIENVLSGILSDVNQYYSLCSSEGLIDSSHIIYYQFDVRDSLKLIIDTSTIFTSFEKTQGNYYSSNIVDPLLPELENVKRVSEEIADIFDSAYKSYCFIVEKSKAYFEESLTATDTHQPHTGLLLTFLQLFKCSQDNLNEFTKRHLDFYYKNVLQLNLKSETPDEANVIFEPAKNVDEHLIEQGTEFKAGKDSSGVDLIYTLDEEFVLNKAKVSSIKNLFVDKSDDSRIYISQFANSKDVNGKEIDTDPPSWKTFGHNNSLTEYPTMTEAEIGFAISSPILLLGEGERKIILSFYSDTEASQIILLGEELDSYLKAEITGPKGWYEISEISVDNNKLKLTIPKDSLSTSAFDSKLHGSGYETDFPILRLTLKTDIDDYGYNLLSSIIFSSIKIETEVNGVKNLILQNELGVLKPEKPFQPFGPIPYIGSVFYIGSNEVFTKKLTFLLLKFDWAKVPDFSEHYEEYLGTLSSSGTSSGGTYMMVFTSFPENSFTAALSQLLKSSSDNEWVSLSSSNINLFNKNSSSGNFEINLTSVFTERNYEQEKFSAYSNDLKSGFIKLELEGLDAGTFEAFGHNVYSKLYTERIINKSLGTDPQDLPNEPYTPLTNSLTIDYKSEVTYAFEADWPEQFYHINPFGIKKIESSSTLIPEFENEGELYIGISDLIPPQNLSLLIQVAEGSENPLVETPEVKWSYLFEEEWVEFESANILKDDTNGLIQSGIILFSIPEEISSSSTLMNSEMFWLRAYVTENSTGVCDAISILAQAATVTFKNNGNAADHLTYPLPAKTISKFKVKDSAVKSVTQPFSSFGGKPIETDEHFYLRISERLRHKDRSIQKWDYERIVLEEFSEIYKVKCLQHTRIENKIILHEECPGHVSLAVIPDLRNKNAVDPFKPLATMSTLDAIHEHVTKRISPFICLDVVNPIYETLLITSTVHLQFGYDAGLYRDKLEQDLIQFLSPWLYDDATEIQFGGSIHKSEIIDFMDELSYVDFVESMELKQDNVTVEFATAKTSISILASSSYHNLTMLTKDTKDEQLLSYCEES